MPNEKTAMILAIETSADETSAAVFSLSLSTSATHKQKRGAGIVSNIIYSQIKQHTQTGGIVPEVAARAHIPKIIPVIKESLTTAGITLSHIDAIAVTIGPGLITSLRIGVDTAKTLAFALAKPIIPINHLEGHLLSAFDENVKYFPALSLIVSGGHTMLVLAHDIGIYEIIGQTVDDAAGEAFDKIVKILDLPYPGGPAIAKLAEKGNKNIFDFPRPMLNQDNFDFSFAGLKTHVLYLWRDLMDKNEQVRADIARATEDAIVDVLVQKTVRAAETHKARSVFLGGGVAANTKLRNTLLQAVQKKTGAPVFIPPASLTTDNAGMIARAASFHYQYGDTTTYDRVTADPNLTLSSWR